MTPSFSSGISDGLATNPTGFQTSVIASFQRQAALRSFAPALELNDKTLTYKALDARSNWVARQLTDLGVRFNDIVGVCLKRTENLVIGILGVLKAGAAYLPLNPEDPLLRLGWILARAAVRFTLTDDDNKSHLPEGASQLLSLDRQPAALEEGECNHPVHLPKPADLAYVIFTSGTTGTPKGVAVTHGALSNVVTDLCRR